MPFYSPLRELIARCTGGTRSQKPSTGDCRPGLYTLLFIAVWILASAAEPVRQLAGETTRSWVKISLGVAAFLGFYLFWQLIFRWLPVLVLLPLTVVAWALVFWQWWMEVYA